MKRTTLIAAATTGMMALTAVAGAAYASTDNAANDAAELTQFLKENPAMNDLIAPVETKTGGKVVGMERNDEASGNGTLVEVDVMMADGSAKGFMVNTDTKMITAQSGDQHGENKGDGDGETNDENGTSESN